MKFEIAYSVEFAEAELTVDVSELAAIAKRCFLFSMDLRLSESIRGLLRATGSQLRLQLRELLNKVFDDQTEELLRANDTIRQVNLKLDAARTDVSRVADTIEGLGALTKQLDDLLKIVGLIL